MSGASDDDRFWWEKHHELARLYEWLLAQDLAPTGADLVYLLDKPWKWEPEYERMLAARAAR